MADDTTSSQLPLFQNVFGPDWAALPKVMQDHYAVRGGGDDVVVVSGHLDVRVAWYMSLMARLTRMLVPYCGTAVPVTVRFTSGSDGKSMILDREFHFPNRKMWRFRSRMLHLGGDVLVEFMRFGIGWKFAMFWQGEKVILQHRGYVWQLFGRLIPLPLDWVIGKGHAEETPLNSQEFSMWTHSQHPILGQSFGYSGTFRIEQVTCGRS